MYVHTYGTGLIDTAPHLLVEAIGPIFHDPTENPHSDPASQLGKPAENCWFHLSKLVSTTRCIFHMPAHGPRCAASACLAGALRRLDYILQKLKVNSAVLLDTGVG